MIGSTDLRIDDPDRAVCTKEEIDYILGMVPKIFPILQVTRDQIVFQFSGVRPLPVAEGSTGQISRDHSIKVMEKSALIPWPILNLVGGKWTSYRAFSEQVTDQVLQRLNLPRRASTASLPIGGGKNYPRDGQARQERIRELGEKSGLSQEQIKGLFDRYGTRAGRVAAYLSGKNDSPLKYTRAYTRQELNFLIEEEMVVHLDDFLLRRSKLAWINQVSVDSITELAEIMAKLLGWSREDQATEVERTLAILRERHSVRI